MCASWCYFYDAENLYLLTSFKFSIYWSVLWFLLCLFFRDSDYVASIPSKIYLCRCNLFPLFYFLFSIILFVIGSCSLSFGSFCVHWFLFCYNIFLLLLLSLFYVFSNLSFNFLWYNISDVSGSEICRMLLRASLYPS